MARNKETKNRNTGGQSSSSTVSNNKKPSTNANENVEECKTEAITIPVTTSSIDITESPEKNNNMDTEVVLFSIFDSTECRFSPTYTTKWIESKHQTLLEVDECTREDTIFIKRVCRDLTRPIKFNSLITCTNESLLPLLAKGKWINDEVVNSMMKILNYKHSVHTYPKKVYFAQTSLYHYLTDKNSNKFDSTGTPVKYPPDSKGFSSYDKIVIPLNHNNKHWSMCVIEPQTKLIYHIDSLQSDIRDETVKKHIQKYIQYEMKKSFLGHIDGGYLLLMKEWKVMFPPSISKKDIPQQIEAAGDCAIFTILFAEAFGFQSSLSSINQHIIDSTEFRMKLCKLILAFQQDIPIVIQSDEDESVVENITEKVSVRQC